MAAKAVALAEAGRRSGTTPGRSSTTPGPWRRGCSGGGRRSSRGAPTTTSCCSTCTGFGLTGRQAELAMQDAGVVANRNSIPLDPNGAWYTSGVRLGTPATTTLGMGAGGDGRDRGHHLLGARRHRAHRRRGGPSKARYGGGRRGGAGRPARPCSAASRSIRRSPCSRGLGRGRRAARCPGDEHRGADRRGRRARRRPRSRPGAAASGGVPRASSRTSAPRAGARTRVVDEVVERLPAGRSGDQGGGRLPVDDLGGGSAAAT